jgi:hypothetical protein
MPVGRPGCAGSRVPAIGTGNEVLSASDRYMRAPPRIAEKRTCPKLIRFSATELQLVEERARVSGRPVACYIRESSLGPSPRIRRTDLSDSLIRALAEVATRLTSLAATAKEQQRAGATEFETAVSEVLGVIRSLD